MEVHVDGETSAVREARRVVCSVRLIRKHGGKCG